MNKLLIVDDDVAVTNYLKVFLMQTERFDTTVVNDSREVPNLLARGQFDVILLDMDMPHMSGMDILRVMHTKGIKTPVVVLTGVNDTELAVNAMKLSAFDYLTKPVDDDHLLSVIDSAIEHHALHDSIQQLPAQLKREDLTFREAFEDIPSQDPAMIRLLHQAEKLAPSDLSIFIHGERGTGKEMIAHAIHSASRGGLGAFVAVDSSAEDPERFAAAFFGQARLWSGEREEQPGFLEEAENGTIYLCEIEHLTRPVQVRLLRVLQRGEYYRENSTTVRHCNVRFIVSSSHDLSRGTYRDTFSRDLLYHLMVNTLSIPPLRERIGDLRFLLEHFRKNALTKIQKPITGFADEYVELLAKHDFPDNIQELRNIVESSMVNSDTPIIHVDALPPYIRQKITDREAPRDDGFIPRPLRDFQREHIQRTLSHFGNNRVRAARELGISQDELDALLGGT
jgi:two-component system response regulator HydG